MRPHTYCLCYVFTVVVVNLAQAQALDSGRVEEISQWLPNSTYSAAPRIESREFWTAVSRHEAYRDIVVEAQKLAAEQFTTLPDSLYLEYSRNGNRSRYQSVFFAKLRAFRTLVVAECVENDGRFVESIQRLVESYARDKTWVLPAHDAGNENFEGRQITIDLFSSEVACDLANADHILGDRLSSDTRTLLRKEIERRIFAPYKQTINTGTPKMWWITGTNNWNAVCLANVTGTALALIDSAHERAFFVAAAEKYVQYFLKGFTDDGYCSEGIGYWNYGYGCFLRLAHIVREATDGNIDILDDAKAKNAGLFARRMEITPGLYPAFADCSVGAKPSRRLMRYVTRYYHLQPTTYECAGYSAMRWLDEFGVFEFVFEKPGGAEEFAALADHDWFDNAGILISRAAQRPIGVAIKGGHNAEHHNHNDVGSFVYCIGNNMTLVDPGAEVYTRRTFSSKRYESDVLNSFGHPVPRAAGSLQTTGRDSKGKVLDLMLTSRSAQITLDLTSAYRVKTLRKLEREFLFDRQSGVLTVSDVVRFESPSQFETAVITFDKWKQLGAKELLVGADESAVVVTIDTGDIGVEIAAIQIEEDVRGGRRPTRIGINLAKPVREATVKLVITPAK